MNVAALALAERKRGKRSLSSEQFGRAVSTSGTSKPWARDLSRSGTYLRLWDPPSVSSGTPWAWPDRVSSSWASDDGDM